MAISARAITATGDNARMPERRVSDGTQLPAGARMAERRVSDGTQLPASQVSRLLTEGDMELEGRLVDASNTTLRAFVTLDGVTVRCVYKPVRGERPLWDFPDGTLAGREVAAYLVSAATGWDVVPHTVMRDGPLGEGACQLWVEEPADATSLVGFVPAEVLPADWLRIAMARDDNGKSYVLAHADDAGLARLALFDVVVNNADRKGGHVLHAATGRLYGVDHGVCFHADDKLRTVLWGWTGRPLPARERPVIAAVRDDLRGDLGETLLRLLSTEEIEATVARVDRLLVDGVFPEPAPGWPAVPWPPI
jgi:uncharacterized repeat protein (TIGR03843 family)